MNQYLGKNLDDAFILRLFKNKSFMLEIISLFNTFGLLFFVLDFRSSVERVFVLYSS